ncbi:hypothetical protein [Mariniplasma anaerobium]|uniref:Uncharacterized protein n=1 Tax=Mariniplasma anaerobium TaxID=2735436 RepID=A0A7U9TJA3_9MOLU|nr:hypothetical protein [Mariniplasma anaerobium]BCR35210.1 hypothetical protein MPAN_001030 [Mariniplasma anaerobium]
MIVREFFDLIKNTNFEISAQDLDNGKEYPRKIRLHSFGYDNYGYPGSGTFKFNVVKTVEGDSQSLVKIYNTYHQIPNDILDMNLIEIVSMSCGAYVKTSSSNIHYPGNNFRFTFLVSENS